MINLIKRLYDLTYKYHEGHIGSCLTALPIIYDIYKNKKPEDIFVLSSGHAGLALYIILERFGLAKSAEDLYNKHGVHPSIDVDNGISCASGSLGHGLPIAVGMALARPNITVHCLISDGECAEGSIYEALNIIREQAIPNIHIHVNANGFAAYKTVDADRLEDILYTILGDMCEQLEFHNTNPLLDFEYLKGLTGHYHNLSNKDYQEFLELYNEKRLCFIP